MMEHYKLIDIIRFLKDQKFQENYEGIEDLLEILLDDRIENHLKHAMISKILSYYGLHHVGSSPPMTEDEFHLFEQFGKEIVWSRLSYRSELFELNMLNGMVHFEVILN